MEPRLRYIAHVPPERLIAQKPGYGLTYRVSIVTINDQSGLTVKHGVPSPAIFTGNGGYAESGGLNENQTKAFD